MYIANIYIYRLYLYRLIQSKYNAVLKEKMYIPIIQLYIILYAAHATLFYNDLTTRGVYNL